MDGMILLYSELLGNSFATPNCTCSSGVLVIGKMSNSPLKSSKCKKVHRIFHWPV